MNRCVICGFAVGGQIFSFWEKRHQLETKKERGKGTRKLDAIRMFTVPPPPPLPHTHALPLANRMHRGHEIPPLQTQARIAKHTHIHARSPVYGRSRQQGGAGAKVETTSVRLAERNRAVLWKLTQVNRTHLRCIHICDRVQRTLRKKGKQKTFREERRDTASASDITRASNCRKMYRAIKRYGNSAVGHFLFLERIGGHHRSTNSAALHGTV